MGFFDDIAKTLKQGLDTASKKGGEMAQAARLRVDLFNQNRDLESAYNKLGKAVYTGADALEQSALRLEIDKMKAEVARLEQELRDIGEDPERVDVDEADRTVTVSAVPPHSETTPAGTPPSSAPKIDLEK
jgi:flagellar hook-associated protein FlgK